MAPPLLLYRYPNGVEHSTLHFLVVIWALIVHYISQFPSAASKSPTNAPFESVLFTTFTTFIVSSAIRPESLLQSCVIGTFQRDTATLPRTFRELKVRKIVSKWLCCIFNASVPRVGDHVPRGKWNLLLSARGEWKKVCVRMNDLLQRARYSFHTLAQHVSVLWFSNLNCVSIDWANYTHSHTRCSCTSLCVRVHYIGNEMVDRCIKYKITNTTDLLIGST